MRQRFWSGVTGGAEVPERGVCQAPGTRPCTQRPATLPYGKTQEWWPPPVRDMRFRP
jgi:hypothetical protein